MRWLISLAFCFMVVGLFLTLSLSPINIYFDLKDKLKPKEQTLGQRIRQIQQPKKQSSINALMDEVKEVLAATNKTEQFSFFSFLAIVLALCGGALALLLGNGFLAPVLACGFGLLPFWYILLTANSYRKQMNAELATALSMITNSYLRTDNILQAIEENVNHLNPPIQDVFESFLVQTQSISANLSLALEGLKPKLNSSIAHEWIDTLIACKEDHSRKVNLQAIVNKFSNQRKVAAEVETNRYEALYSVVVMGALLISNFPIMYFLNQDLFQLLVNTLPGKLVTAFAVAILLLSIGGTIKLIKPLEYQDH